jgi:hypothetical protein
LVERAAAKQTRLRGRERKLLNKVKCSSDDGSVDVVGAAQANMGKLGVAAGLSLFPACSRPFYFEEPYVQGLASGWQGHAKSTGVLASGWLPSFSLSRAVVERIKNNQNSHTA